MDHLYSTIKVNHIINSILVAWPFYGLVVVNQRARLGPPLGDRVDAYLEVVIKNRAVPCFVFQATALISGLAMVALSSQSLSPLLENPRLGAKFLLLLLISFILSYVHFYLQPRIDALFNQAGAPIAPEIASQIGILRLRRKRLASVCMFVVLTISMLGVQAWRPLPWWLTAALAVLIAAFTWRPYKTGAPYGWI